MRTVRDVHIMSTSKHIVLNIVDKLEWETKHYNKKRGVSQASEKAYSHYTLAPECTHITQTIAHLTKKEQVISISLVLVGQSCIETMLAVPASYCTCMCTLQGQHQCNAKASQMKHIRPHKPQKGHSAFVLLAVLELLSTVTAASPDAAVSSTAAAGVHNDWAGSFVPASAGLNSSASCNSL